MTTSFNIANETDLNNAITAIDIGGGSSAINTTYTFNFTGGFTDSADILAINLAAGSTLDIVGNGDTISGGGAHRGLFVYAGVVNVTSLTIASMLTQGGAGGNGKSGGGGGAGLGGGLFIAGSNVVNGTTLATGGTVTLTAVTFASDTAMGGHGGNNTGSSYVGGGGGMGGAGGTGGYSNYNFFFGGGGGIGAGATGGSFGGGSDGIVVGVAAAGNGGAGGGGGAAASSSNDGGASGHGGGVGASGTLGAGGFGGGGGADGGAGGFGGGGGDKGGAGGFGGGGGGGFVRGAGGFGGGIGGYAQSNGAGGGGGLGAGGDIFVQAGGTLIINSGTLAGGGVTGGEGGGNGAGVGSAFGTGIFIQGNNTITFAPTGAQSVADVITDEIGSGGTAGAGGVLVTGSGTLTLNAVNTYTGGTTISGATVRDGVAQAIGPGALAVNSGTFDLAGHNQTSAALSGGGSITLGGGTLTVGSTLSSSFTGGISGAGVLIKQGAGTLSLGGGENITSTTISAGTVRLTGAGGLSGAVNDGGTLDVNGTNATIDTLSGGGALVLSGGGTLTTGTTANIGVSLTISGNGTLVEQGSGALGLSGNNNYSGGTLIKAGTLNLNSANASGSGSITFSGANTGLAMTTGTKPAGALIGFATGDSVIITNLLPGGTEATLQAGNTLSIPVLGGGTFALKLDPSADLSADHYHIVSNGVTGTVLSVVQQHYTVTSLAELNAALSSIDVGGVAFTSHTAYTIDIVNDITFLGTVDSIELATGSSVTIDGHGHLFNGQNNGGQVFSGGSSIQGFGVAAGTVTLENLTLKNLTAQGGFGSSSNDITGGGGAGLGGGLSAAAGTSVRLSNVTFTGDQAKGGRAGFFNAAYNGYYGGSGTAPGSGLGAGGHPASQGQFGGGAGANDGVSSPHSVFGGGNASTFAGGGGLGAGGAIFVQDGATLEYDGGSISGNGATGGTGGGGAGSAFGTGIFLQGYATIVFAPPSGQTVSVGDDIDDQNGSDPSNVHLWGDAAFGSVVVDGGGKVVLSGNNNFSGGATVSQGATLEVANTLAGGGSTIGGGTIALLGHATLQVDFTTPMPQTVNIVAGGDGTYVIDLPNLAYHHGAQAVVNGSTLDVISNGVTQELKLGSVAGGTLFSVIPDGGSGTELVACYCPGTRILTEAGERAIETLAIGDRVVTERGVQPILWIGRRAYSGRFVPGNRRILPVCIKAGALGGGVPHRDLHVSPLHAMYFDGILIDAGELVNGVTIIQAESVESVEYYNLEFEQHEVIFAEGAAAESFVGDESRGLFENAHEYYALYPDAPKRPTIYVAPRLDHGYAVHGVRRRLALQAGLEPERIARASAHRPRGFVDTVAADRVVGWAQSADHPEERVSLELFLHGRSFSHALANRYRADLRKAGLGSGFHAFRFEAPEGVAFAEDSIEIHRAFDGAVLPRNGQARKREAAA